MAAVDPGTPSLAGLASKLQNLYLYDATGTKLSSIVTNQAGQHRTDYCGSFIYQDNVLQMVNLPEGPAPHFAAIVQKDQFCSYGMKPGALSTITDVEYNYTIPMKV